MSRALVIVGKAPEAGMSKTRLTPPLAPTEAAHLYAAFLRDTVDVALGLGWERVTIMYPPTARAHERLSGLVPSQVRLVEQRGVGLGAALGEAFLRHARDGFDRVVLIGSDNPTLPGSICEEASELLDSHDLVLGPATDGGYYLIAMSRPHLGLFEGISWSTSVVLSETLARARDLGLTVATVAEWYDVDTAAGLARLRSELEPLPRQVAPRTRRALAALPEGARLSLGLGEVAAAD